MRLIDADALRQAILSTMPERSEVLLIVDSQPDAVVRCGQCLYGIKKQCVECWNLDTVRPPDWFCADGKRR